MIRKSAVAVTAAAALALGTASATSLGTFDSPTFAATDVDLLACGLGTTLDPAQLISLVPDVPTTGTLTSSGSTFDASLADVSALVTELTALDVECVTDTVLEIVLLDATDGVLEVLSIDPDSTTTDFASISLSNVFDVVSVDEVRAVLRDA